MDSAAKPKKSGDLTPFGRRVRDLRKLRGISVQVLAESVGFKAGQSIYDLEYGNQQPDDDIYEALARSLSTTRKFLEKGEGPRDSGRVVSLVDRTPTRARGQDESVSLDNLAFVKFSNQPVQGGDGAAIVEDEAAIGWLAFDRKWLRGAAPSGSIRGIFALTVRENSMAPQIADSDVILVDTRSRTPTSHQVFVVRIGGQEGLIVKELRENDKIWFAYSRNPDVKKKPFRLKLEEDGGDEIYGRVFWRAGKV